MDRAIQNKIVSFIRSIKANLSLHLHFTPAVGRNQRIKKKVNPRHGDDHT
jgi:hypothetical protein